MTILVLGGDGYLGWPLALTLALRHPSARVVIADNLVRRRQVAALGGNSITPILEPAARLAAAARLVGRANLDYVDIDVSTPALAALVARLRPAVVYHLAPQASAPYSMTGVDEAVYTLVNNEVGNMRLLWALRSHAPEAHLVKLGSFGEYAQCGLEIPEGYFVPSHAGALADRPVPFPREADDIYHITKIHDTNYSALACRKWDLRVTDVMQCTAFGATVTAAAGAPALDTRLDHDAVFGTVVNRFAAQIVAGQPMTVYGSGHQRTGLMALDDAVASLARLVERPPAPGEHRVINHVTERDLSINEIAAALQQVAAARGFTATISRIHDPRGETPDIKAVHTVCTDYVDAHVVATPFATAVDQLFAAVALHRARINPSLFPPQIAWRPDETSGRAAAE